jgi:hypothetical protein
MGGRSAAERARNVEMWNVPAARRVFRIMTLVWGVGLMLEAVSRVVVTLNLPLTTATAISPFLSIGALGGLALWTFGYARWARRRRAIATANAA